MCNRKLGAMVPSEQPTWRSNQIVYGIRCHAHDSGIGALQREELCQIYPQGVVDEKSSEWEESPNLLPTKHPRPLEVLPPTRRPKTIL